MYVSCQCGTGCSFDAKIVKLGWYIGSSTEIVAFQVYEILKIEHEFLRFVIFTNDGITLKFHAK